MQLNACSVTSGGSLYGSFSYSGTPVSSVEITGANLIFEETTPTMDTIIFTPVQATPEPSTFLLAVPALAALMARRRKRT